MKYLGIIPARGGSKRIPRKNVLPLCGKPLIYWSIDAALKSKRLGKVVVSTEDTTISHMSELYGVDSIRRPYELSEDDVPLTPVIKNVLDNIKADNVVILRPTSPIRIDNIIDKAIEEYEINKADCLMTGFINKEYEWFTHPDTPSQKLKGWFQGDGCVEIVKSDIIHAGSTYGDKPFRYIIPEIYNHEIDTELDVVIVKAIMEYIGCDI